MRSRCKGGPPENSEVLVSELSLAKQDVMSLPARYRVGTVGRSDSVQASPPAYRNLLMSRPRGSPDDSYPDFKGDSSGRKIRGPLSRDNALSFNIRHLPPEERVWRRVLVDFSHHHKSGEVCWKVCWKVCRKGWEPAREEKSCQEGRIA